MVCRASGAAWTRRLFLAALTIALVCSVRALASSATAPERPPTAVAQTLPSSEPHLPDAPDPVGELHRDKTGKIVVTDPTTQQGTGQRACSAGVVCVGPGQAYRTLSAALAAVRQGDVIEVVGGVYHETARIAHRNVTIRGINGRPHFDCKGVRIAGDKACLLLAADGITLENLEISGAEISQASGANGACIRNEPNASFTLRKVICHGSQEGILSDGGSIVIEDSEFYDNGWTDRTHNVYLGGNCASVTVRGSTFRDARIGHEFKARCRKTTISDSTFRSTRGSRNIDLPDGGEAMIYRSTFTKGTGAQSQEIIGYAAESCRYPGSLVLKQVRIVNTGGDTDIRNFDTCAGGQIVLEGVTFEGTPPRLIGLIRKQ
jgi:hypothetical protein